MARVDTKPSDLGEIHVFRDGNRAVPRRMLNEVEQARHKDFLFPYHCCPMAVTDHVSKSLKTILGSPQPGTERYEQRERARQLKLALERTKH
jgi:hypothetical protein